MEKIRGLIGLKKKDNKVSAQKTLVELHETERLLTKKREFLESQIEELTNLAKFHGLKNKPAAKKALKKRSLLHRNIEQVEGMLTNIQAQLEALEGVNMNKNVIEAMGQGVVALKAANESMDLGKVNDLMDMMVEQQDIGQDIVDAIQQPISSRADVDEDDLEKELEALEQEELDKVLLTVIRDPETKDEPVPSSSNGNDGKAVPVTTSDVFKKADTTKSPAAAKAKAEAKEDEEELEKLREWSISGV